MPEPTCPFCEAPALCHQNFSNEAMVDIVSKYACGTSSSEHHAIDSVSAPNFQRADFCIARQRLFDDIMAEMMGGQTVGVAIGVSIAAVTGNKIGADEIKKALTDGYAETIRIARGMTELRYPLPAKDAPDAHAP